MSHEGTFLWQSAQKSPWVWTAAVMPGQKTVDIVCKSMERTLWWAE